MGTDTLFNFGGVGLMRMAFSAMLAILFLQSGLSKLFGWKGEREWLTGHFAKSPLKGMVPVLLPVITILEVLAGACSLLGVAEVLLRASAVFGPWGAVLGTLCVIMLFFGQRMVKDYAGAASLVPYFLLCAGAMLTYMW